MKLDLNNRPAKMLIGLLAALLLLALFKSGYQSGKRLYNKTHHFEISKR